MGLDYSMFFLVTKDNRDKIYNYIESHGKLKNSCCSIIFNMDYVLIKYLQGWNDYKMEYNFQCYNRGKFSLQYNDCEHILDFSKVEDEKKVGIEILEDGRIEVGGFDIYEKKNGEDYIISLTAVTTDMSLLLEQSYAVHQWVVDCCKYAGAKIGYLSYESNGLRVIWSHGKFVDIPIGDNTLDSMSKEEAIEMMRTLKQVLDSN